MEKRKMISEFYSGTFITLFYDNDSTDAFKNIINTFIDYTAITKYPMKVMTLNPEKWYEYDKDIDILTCSPNKANDPIMLLPETDGFVIVDCLNISASFLSACASKDKRVIIYIVKSARTNIRQKYKAFIEKSETVVVFNDSGEEIIKGGYSPIITPEIYKAESEKLFAEWKGKAQVKTPFITDGVMDPDHWFSQKVRPLFLLKEAYGGDIDWDLASDHVMADEKIKKIWKRMSLWAKGIFGTNISQIEPYDPNDDELNRFGNKYLSKISAINIKKYDGKSTSNYVNINSFAKKDAEFLKREISLCDPTVIICGYTAASLDIIFDCKLREQKNDNLYYHMMINNHDVLVIDYWHPSNRYPEIMNYYCLLELYRKALEEQLAENLRKYM